MSGADRERYARDKERILARQAKYKKQHGERWREGRLKRYAAEPMQQTKAIWSTMIRRCHDPKHDAYSYYGGRGITVCQRWRDSFQAFLDDMGVRPQGLMIDRRDNNLGYEPANCWWATRSHQMKNRRPLPVNCNCGICRRCKNREAVRRYRSRKEVV